MKPDFRLYKRDVTEYWVEEIRKKAGQIFDLYIFDCNKTVNCCEIAPSFEMHYLGPMWTLSPEDEDEDQKLFEDILGGIVENHDVIYVHTRYVSVDDCERVETSDEDWAKFLRDADGDEEAAWHEVLEKWSEYCRGNGVCY